MNKNTFLNARGTSLLELLLVVALVGILSVFLSGIFRNAIDLYQNQDLEIRVIESANLLNTFLLTNLRRAEGVEDTVTDGGDTFASGDDEIVLRVPAIDGSGNPIVGVYDYFVFYKDTVNVGDFRWRAIPNASSARTAFDRLAAEEITSLLIEYDTLFPEEANLVTVTFTLEKENYAGTQSITRSTSINMRNQ